MFGKKGPTAMATVQPYGSGGQDEAGLKRLKGGV